MQQRKPFLATTSGVLLACLAACLLWGSAFPCVKIGNALFGIGSADVSSLIAFAGARFTIAGTMVVLGMSVARGRPFVPASTDWRPIVVLCLFQTVLQYLCFYTGLSRSAGITSSIIESANSFFIVLLAALAFRTEALTARKLAGCVLGFAGVVLVNLTPGSGGLSFGLGELLILGSTLAGAVSSNLAKRYASAGHDPVLLSGWQFLVGGLLMLVCGLAMGGRIAPADAANPIPAICMLFYLGFISAAAYSLWSSALAVNPASRVAVFGFMNPVFGAALSALLLGEGSLIDPALAVAALVLVSLGIVVVNK